MFDSIEQEINFYTKLAPPRLIIGNKYFSSHTLESSERYVGSKGVYTWSNSNPYSRPELSPAACFVNKKDSYFILEKDLLNFSSESSNSCIMFNSDEDRNHFLENATTLNGMRNEQPEKPRAVEKITLHSARAAIANGMRNCGKRNYILMSFSTIIGDIRKHVDFSNPVLDSEIIIEVRKFRKRIL
jgi:hypothetical protein